jgi:hypothetical protein
MGREVKRVPLDFDQPMGKVWPGYLSPDWRPCPSGDCYNGETIGGRWVDGIVHLLMMLGEEARRTDRPLHPWLTALELAPSRRPTPDVIALCEGLAGRPAAFFGHDACDQWSAVGKIVAAAGLPEDHFVCKVCQGHGIHPEDYAASEAWQRTEPPTGEGWQVWETVSEGSPISPVFATPEELAAWMSENGTGLDAGKSKETWLAFIHRGWAPSLVMDSRGVRSGVDA